METELINQNLKWENYRERTTVEGHNVITEKSICRCPIGGKISVVDTTQIEGNAKKNALLSQIESLINQSIQKVANDMKQIRNDMGLADKKLDINDKMKIFREFEEVNPYYKNFERLYGREQKNIMKEQVLDEVLYQVRTEEGYTWMSKRDLIFMVLIFFMLFGMLEREKEILLMSIVFCLSISNAGDFYLLSTLAGAATVAGGVVVGVVLVVVVGALIVENLQKDTSGDDTVEKDVSEDISISIGTTGYVQGIDSLSYIRNFSLNNTDVMYPDFSYEKEDEKLNILKAKLGLAMLSGDYVAAQEYIDALKKRLKGKSYETYLKYGKIGTEKEGMLYPGKTSGIYINIDSPMKHVKKRDYKHKISKPDFEEAILDKSTRPTGNTNEEPLPIVKSISEMTYEVGNGTVVFSKEVLDYIAISGREQILIEKFGGIGHPKLENVNNGVAYGTPMYNISKNLAKLYYGDDVENWEIPGRPLGDGTKTWTTVKKLKEEMGIK